MVIAETQRIWIRELTIDDVPELARMLSDPEVMRHSVRGVLTEEDTRRFVEWCMGLYETQGLGPWALVEKSSEELIGFCGLGPETVEGVEEIHVGYRLARRFWGRGLATEAAVEVVAHGLGVRCFESVIAIVEPDHVASCRVAEKAGFSSFVPAVFHDRDVRIYRQTRDQWCAKAGAPRVQPTH